MQLRATTARRGRQRERRQHPSRQSGGQTGDDIVGRPAGTRHARDPTSSSTRPGSKKRGRTSVPAHAIDPSTLARRNPAGVEERHRAEVPDHARLGAEAVEVGEARLLTMPGGAAPRPWDAAVVPMCTGSAPRRADRHRGGVGSATRSRRRRPVAERHDLRRLGSPPRTPSSIWAMRVPGTGDQKFRSARE